MIRSNRTSMIANASQASEEHYNVPILTTNNIVDILESLGIMANEDDFIRPIGSRIRQMYLLIIEMVMPYRLKVIDERREKITREFESVPLAEEMIESLPIYKEIKTLLTELKYKDFKLTDVTAPTSDRIRNIFSTLLDFVLFRDTKISEFDEIANNATSLASKAKEMVLEYNELQATFSKKEEDRKSEQEEISRLEKLNNEIHGVLLEKKVQYSKAEEEANKAKKRKAKWQEDFTNISYEMTQKYRRTQELNYLLSIDIDTLLTNVTDLQEQLNMYTDNYNELNNKLETISSHFMLVKSMSTNVDKCLKLLNNFIKTRGEAVRHKKTNDALQVEISAFEKIDNERRLKLESIKRNLDFQNSRLDKLKKQQEKKRQSMDVYFQTYNERMVEVEGEIKEKESVIQEHERNILKTQEEMKMLSLRHKNEIDNLMFKLEPVIVYIKRTQEQLHNLSPS
ncbi:Nuf2 family-domain-containing protein [Cokeromyces recurvatus]|uniref:Nuf2 family-domain-containing protein n=1 Tax=Cokeromyces recurvatus TaxID=90255 RepID=UPI00221E858E|nr:Nuf2 family-domain-containing protein [Cokeromyces recurvatus]KAI7902485.1 Nuf2 family-domain-containing protein [Cokeromyces recurvatus]